MMVVTLVVLTLILAFANGANDISKGIATLVGSGVSNYKAAVVWGTLCTAAGSLTAAVATQALVSTFSGRGLLTNPTTGHAFLLAVAVGAILWLVIATRMGLPVSTTHSLMGALCGSGIAAAGVAGVVWPAVAKKAALPLALSPLIAVAVVAAFYPLVARRVAAAGERCVCVTESVMTPSGGVALARPQIMAADTVTCGNAPRLASGFATIDALHWLFAGTTSFFRGMNDTPKILAIGVAAAAVLGVEATPFYVAVAAAMAAGSLTWGFRVTETLAHKVTPISPQKGFIANLVTSALVATASFAALPVSTTQVASGAIVGIGVAGREKSVEWKTVGEVLTAWVFTLPAAALFAGGTYLLLT